MADVGTVTGVVGMLTGIAGSIMGGLGLWQSKKNKVLDLRLQLRRDTNTLRATIGPLPETIDKAQLSRTRVLAALGVGQSGATRQFETECVADKSAVAVIASSVPNPESDYFSLSERELELRLGEINRLTLEAQRYKEKYESALAWDETKRSEIGSRHTAMAVARTQSPPRD